MCARVRRLPRSGIAFQGPESASSAARFQRTRDARANSLPPRRCSSPAPAAPRPENQVISAWECSEEAGQRIARRHESVNTRRKPFSLYHSRTPHSRTPAKSAHVSLPRGPSSRTHLRPSSGCKTLACQVGQRVFPSFPQIYSPQCVCVCVSVDA